MEKKLFLFVAITSCLVFSLTEVRAQDTEKPLAEILNWMVGSWEGEGAAKGGSQFIGKLDVTPELDDAALLVSRESMNKEGGPSGGKKEIFLIGYDGTTKKLIGTLYDNKGTIALFAGEITGEEVVFNIAIPAPQQGFVNRITFRHLSDGGISFFMEEGTPRKVVSKVVEINFKKK